MIAFLILPAFLPAFCSAALARWLGLRPDRPDLPSADTFVPFAVLNGPWPSPVSLGDIIAQCNLASVVPVT